MNAPALRVRIVADDLTGALDSAAAFGAGVPVHLGAVPADGDTATVEVVATGTRDLPLDQLAARIEPALRWLAAAPIAFKKVDSLLRGNTFDEVALAARIGGFEHVVFAPAFPAQGRITQAGRQCLQHDGGVPRAVEAPAIDVALRARGFDVVTGSATPAQASVWVPDVLDSADLQRVVAAAGGDWHDVARPASRWLWIGSAGLAQALARALPSSVAPQAVSMAEPAASIDLLISASWQPTSRRQWNGMLGACGPAAVARDGNLVALAAAARTLVEGQATLGLFDLAPVVPVPAARAAAMLREQMALLVAGVPRPRRLIVIGGDTLLALCRASGVSALRSAAALARPGWGSAVLEGGVWHGTRCHTRSGAFGGDDDLIEALRAVRD